MDIDPPALALGMDIDTHLLIGNDIALAGMDISLATDCTQLSSVVLLWSIYYTHLHVIMIPDTGQFTLTFVSLIYKGLSCNSSQWYAMQRSHMELLDHPQGSSNFVSNAICKEFRRLPFEAISPTCLMFMYACPT